MLNLRLFVLLVFLLIPSTIAMTQINNQHLVLPCNWSAPIVPPSTCLINETELFCSQSDNRGFCVNHSTCHLTAYYDSSYVEDLVGYEIELDDRYWGYEIHYSNNDLVVRSDNIDTNPPPPQAEQLTRIYTTVCSNFVHPNFTQFMNQSLNKLWSQPGYVVVNPAIDPPFDQNPLVATSLVDGYYLFLIMLLLFTIWPYLLSILILLLLFILWRRHRTN